MVMETTCLLGSSTYTATERHVAVARRWVCDLLSGHVDEETLYDAALCSAELIDNARKHGSPDGMVTVAVYLGDDLVRIEAVNDAGGCTVPHVTDMWCTEDGHGLQIVAGIARDWGTCPADDSKQVVWCEFANAPKKGGEDVDARYQLGLSANSRSPCGGNSLILKAHERGARRA